MFERISCVIRCRGQLLFLESSRGPQGRCHFAQSLAHTLEMEVAVQEYCVAEARDRARQAADASDAAENRTARAPRGAAEPEGTAEPEGAAEEVVTG